MKFLRVGPKGKEKPAALDQNNKIIVDVNNVNGPYNGQNLVATHDISKWIPEHPGGSVIYRAIEANDFYSKSLKTKSEQSPTQLFMGNPIHKMEDSNGRSVFQRFFIDGNDMIPRVGVLNS